MDSGFLYIIVIYYFNVYRKDDGLMRRHFMTTVANDKAKITLKYYLF